LQTIFYQTEQGICRRLTCPLGIIALVGGGGKTTLMLQMARELSKSGARVIVSTTTHIFPPEGIASSNPETVKSTKTALEQNNRVASANMPNREALRSGDFNRKRWRSLRLCFSSRRTGQGDCR
jgi:replicative DNA helicase